MSRNPHAIRFDLLHSPVVVNAVSDEESTSETDSSSSVVSTATLDSSGPGRRRSNAERHAFLQWIGKEIRRSKSVPSLAHSIQARERRTEHHRRVSDLLNKSEALVERADQCLQNSTGNRRADKREKKALLQELIAHLNDIRQLTVTLENSGSTGSDANQMESPSPSMPPASLQGLDREALGEDITARCLEVMNALPRLCIAACRPQPAGQSILDFYFQVDEELPLGAELDDMLACAGLAQTVYDGDAKANLAKVLSSSTEYANQSWRSMAIPENLLSAIQSICPNMKTLEDGRFCDSDSGLVLQVFENPEARKIVLAFGGTTAGEAKGPLFTRLLSNPWITATQWRANLAGATGLSALGGPVPDSYDRAARIAGLMSEHVRTRDTDDDWTVCLTGHSKGGAEAEYAALRNELPAICFGTPELGKGVLESATTAQLQAGSRNIRHYFVKGDVAPLVSTGLAHLLPNRFAHIGTGYWMEPTPEVGNTPISRNLWCHDLFFQSALHEAAKQRPPITES